MSYSAPTGLIGTPSGFTIPLTWGPSILVGSAPALLLHFDGTNGQTTTVDSSPNNWSVSINQAVGGGAPTPPTLSTTTPEFGTAALFVSNLEQWNVIGAGGIGYACRVPASGGYTAGSLLDIFATNTWTIECWFRIGGPNSVGAIADVLDYGSPGDNLTGGTGAFANLQAVTAGDGLTGQYKVYTNILGFTTTPLVTATMPMVSGTWYHLAIVNDVLGTGCKLYVNGVASATDTTTFTPANYAAFGSFHAGSAVCIGSSNSHIVTMVDHQVDEFAVWNTVKYTTNFTPPSAPFSGSGIEAPGYDVYRNGVSIDTYTGPSTIGYTDTVPGGGTYTYTVAGWGSGSDLSPLSAPYVVTIAGLPVSLQAKFVPALNFKAIMVANPGNINPRIYPPQIDNTVRAKP